MRVVPPGVKRVVALGGRSPVTVLPPFIQTRNPQNVTSVSADLQALIATNGAATTVQFEWATDAYFNANGGYNNTTLPEVFSHKTGTQVVRHGISGLTANTAYHFRAVGGNAAQSPVYGLDKTFTTSATGGGGTGPDATTGPATSIMDTSATLEGRGNPNGVRSGGYFEYREEGTATWFNTIADIVDLGSGTTSLPYTYDLTGLMASTTYEYRAVVRNTVTPFASDFGDVLTFTTQAGGGTGSAPTVTTGAPTGAIFSGAEDPDVVEATMAGTVNPNGEATDAYFEFRRVGPEPDPATPTVWRSTTPQAMGSGSAAVAITQIKSDFYTGGTFEIRVVATNASGTTVDPNVVTWNALPSSSPGQHALRIHKRDGSSSLVSTNAANERIEVLDRAGIAYEIVNIPDSVPPTGEFPVYDRASTEYLIPFDGYSPPGIKTLADCGVSQTTACCAAEINPNGSIIEIGDCYVEVFARNTTSPLVASATHLAQLSGSSQILVQLTVNGLTANTDYDYRFTAINAQGLSTVGVPQPFTTAASGGGSGNGCGTQNPPGGMSFPTYADPCDSASGLISETNERQFSTDIEKRWRIDNTGVSNPGFCMITPPPTVNLGVGAGNTVAFPFGSGGANDPVAYSIQRARIGDVIRLKGPGGIVGFGTTTAIPRQSARITWGAGKTVTGVSVVQDDPTIEASIELVVLNNTKMNNVYFKGISFIMGGSYDATSGNVNTGETPIRCDNSCNAQQGLLGLYDCTFSPWPNQPAPNGHVAHSGFGFKWAVMRGYRMRWDIRRCKSYPCLEHFLYNDGNNPDGAGGANSGGCWLIDHEVLDTTPWGVFKGGDGKNPIQISNRLIDDPNNPWTNGTPSGGFPGKGPILIKGCTIRCAGSANFISVFGHLGTVTIEDVTCIAPPDNKGRGIHFIVGPGHGMHVNANGFVTDRVIIRNVTINNGTIGDGDHLDFCGVEVIDIYLDGLSLIGPRYAIGLDSLGTSANSCGNANFAAGIGSNPCGHVVQPADYMGRQTIRLHTKDATTLPSAHDVFLEGTLQGSMRINASKSAPCTFLPANLDPDDYGVFP